MNEDEVKQRTHWFNVYQDGFGLTHKTRTSADNQATPERIALLKITIDGNDVTAEVINDA